MRNKLLKIASLFIAAILLVTTFSACASYDENYQIYDIWVAGVKVTTRNSSDILGDGTVSYVGDGKSGILTLNGANIAECSDEDAEAFIVSTIDHLTINLVGENKLGMGEKPIVVSEFGAGAIPGYRSPYKVKWSEDLQVDILSESIDIFLEKEVAGILVWQFADIRVSAERALYRPRCFNNKGLLSEDRVKKLAFEYVKERFLK